MKKAFKLFKECRDKGIFDRFTYIRIYGDSSGCIKNDTLGKKAIHIPFDIGKLGSILKSKLAEYEEKTAKDAEFSDKVWQAVKNSYITKEQYEKMLEDKFLSETKNQPLNKEMFDKDNMRPTYPYMEPKEEKPYKSISIDIWKDKNGNDKHILKEFGFDTTITQEIWNKLIGNESTKENAAELKRNFIQFLADMNHRFDLHPSSIIMIQEKIKELSK